MTGMLDGKVTLVTGAGGGIGYAAVRLFAEEGARLLVSDRSLDNADRIAAAVREQGGEAVAVAADLTRRSDIEAMIERVVEVYGRIDCAFNNAGVTGGQIGQGGRKSAEWDEEAFDQIINVNLKGTWLCMVAEIRQILAQGGAGSIVNTSSLAGFRGVITTTGYAASKHAVIGMTKTAALEYAPDIRINALCPGFVNTGMLQDTMSRRGDMILNSIPYKRLADPREIAQMVCWVLSDRAGYYSGQAFAVDGAVTAA